MSDPMKSADIEDVLSSIRRLVADTPDCAQAPATAAGNRLLLTPALRVTDPAPLVLTNPQVAEPLVLGDAILPDARGQGGADPSGVSGTISRDEAPMAADVPHGAPADVAPADVGPGSGENRDPDAPGPSQGLGRAGHLLLVPAARAPVDEAYEDEDYDEYDLSDLQDIRPLSLRRDALQDDALLQVSDPSATDLTPESDVAGRDAVSEAQAEALSLEDKISRLESLIGAGQGAPETGTAFFHRSATLDWEDAAPRQAVQDSAAAPADHPQQDVPAAPLSLDDAVLRDLVAGIIREELKGVLGERITRNVRKLVRREINRMLVSQDFD
ncbi:MAG: hypothetical protein EBS68_17360 [Rhodobacteraceae bacterium]|nr:hypothetical protein [Paracoccaceae bacterium]